MAQKKLFERLFSHTSIGYWNNFKILYTLYQDLI